MSVHARLCEEEGSGWLKLKSLSDEHYISSRGASFRMPCIKGHCSRHMYRNSFIPLSLFLSALHPFIPAPQHPLPSLPFCIRLLSRASLKVVTGSLALRTVPHTQQGWRSPCGHSYPQETLSKQPLAYLTRVASSFLLWLYTTIFFSYKHTGIISVLFKALQGLVQRQTRGLNICD